MDECKIRLSLGLIMGIFFGLFGFLGVFTCCDNQQKDAFSRGYLSGIVIHLVICAVIILVFGLMM